MIFFVVVCLRKVNRVCVYIYVYIYIYIYTHSNTVKTHLPPSAAYMRQWIGSALVQIMACRLFGAKPLSESVLTYCQLGPLEQSSVKFESKLYHFHSRKCNWKCRLSNWRPFCPGGRWFNQMWRHPFPCSMSGQTRMYLTSFVVVHS